MQMLLENAGAVVQWQGVAGKRHAPRTQFLVEAVERRSGQGGSVLAGVHIRDLALLLFLPSAFNSVAGARAGARS
jgi:hypothetical protein